MNGQRQQPEHRKAHRHDHDPRQLGQLLTVVGELAAGQPASTPRPRTRARSRARTAAPAASERRGAARPDADRREVGRHQRQHAGRGERDQPGAERDRGVVHSSRSRLGVDARVHRRVGRSRRRAGGPPRPPRPGSSPAHGERRPAQQHRGRDHPGQQVEAVLGRRGQHLLPVLRDQLVQRPLPRPALLVLLLDLLAGLRRLTPTGTGRAACGRPVHMTWFSSSASDQVACAAAPAARRPAPSTAAQHQQPAHAAAFAAGA